MPLVAPTWLPDELRQLPVFVKTDDRGVEYVLSWGSPVQVYSAGNVQGIPEPPLRIDVRFAPSATDEADFYDDTQPVVDVRGRRGGMSQSFPGSGYVSWSVRSAGSLYGVSLETPALDPRFNCRELLAVARSFRPFHPIGSTPSTSGALSRPQAGEHAEAIRTSPDTS